VNLTELAEQLQGELLGDPNCSISGLASIESAKSGEVTFVLEPSYIKSSKTSKASAYITFKELSHVENQIVVKNPRKALADVLNLFFKKTHPFSSTSSLAIISDSANIGTDSLVHHYSVIEEHVTIGSNTVIYNNVSIGAHTTIGSNCVIHANVSVYDHVTIGDNVIIHSGTVVGSDGFGFYMDDGSFKKVPQTGGVVIHDYVEIQANSVIDRGTIGDTTIGEGTKIDNLVHIAHNTTVGKSTVIAAQVGCTGRTSIGNYVSIGGQVGIDAATIEDKVMVAGKTAVTKRVKSGSIISGNPAMDHRKTLKKEAFLRKLCEKEGIL
jgi:UDP-3-O-[3-hydroxymyristoyl] glucosamine N-acyltransferase